MFPKEIFTILSLLFAAFASYCFLKISSDNPFTTLGAAVWFFASSGCSLLAAAVMVLCECRDHLAGKVAAPRREPAMLPTIIPPPPKPIPPVVAVPPVTGPVCVVPHRR